MTRRRDKAATIARIRDAARFLFENTGYFEVTLRAIAHRAGFSHASVRAHFGDKAALWVEVMGCPAPDLRLAEEIALAAVVCPGQPVQLYAHGQICRASIGNPARALMVHGAGSFHGEGDTPAEAVRQARISADRLAGERLAA